NVPSNGRWWIRSNHGPSGVTTSGSGSMPSTDPKRDRKGKRTPSPQPTSRILAAVAPAISRSICPQTQAFRARHHQWRCASSRYRRAYAGSIRRPDDPFDDVGGSVLDFVEDPSEILADDSQKQQL